MEEGKFLVVSVKSAHRFFNTITNNIIFNNIMFAMILLFLSLCAFSCTAAQPRQFYVDLFKSLSEEGCHSCISAGYGWKDSKCGGFNGGCKEEENTDRHSDRDLNSDRDSDRNSDHHSSESWENTPTATRVWNIIASGDTNALQEEIFSDQDVATLRSADGRGPLFWAMEHQNKQMVEMLIKNGAKVNAKDAEGKTPSNMEHRAVVTGDDDDDSINDVDVDPIEDDNDDDDDLTGFATAGIDISVVPKSREEYQALWKKLTKAGCKACQSAGYGWSHSSKKCGGFATMTKCKN